MSRLSSLVQRSVESPRLQICNIFARNKRNPDCYSCSLHARVGSCIDAFPRYFIKDILEASSYE